MDDCWNRVGVSGDRSCPTLAEVVHCRNCPVYSRAGRSLLERQPPPGYLAGWTAVLADGSGGQHGSEVSAANAAVDERVVGGGWPWR